MGITRYYQHLALAFLAICVIGLYAGAFAFRDPPAQVASLAWVGLPTPAPPRALRLAEAPPVAARATPHAAEPLGVADLNDKFSAAAFDLEAVREDDRPVPRLFVKKMPRDLKTLTEAGELKRTFFKVVLPLTLKVNEEIRNDRHELTLLHKRLAAGRPLSDEQRTWLETLAARYGAPAEDLPELLRRVDTISPALALAQSAEESGWGRSRFARHGNALFGQRTWDAGSGIVPRQRDDDSRHEVRAFDTLLDSVRSYARNLNGHPAYADFRARRAAMRSNEATLDPYRLIETLTAYSERREEYVETIAKILRVDNLEQLEDTQLADRPVATTQLLERRR